MDNLPETFVDSRDFARIARAIRFIDLRFREQPRLRDVAQHVGLSEFHFNRLFRRWAGVTPKQYLAFVTGRAARGALAAQSSVLAAAHEVGLSGPGRLHDLVVTLEAMTPGELKGHGAGLTIRCGVTPTPFGSALIGETPRGICHLSFVDEAGDAAEAAHLLDEQIRGEWPRAAVRRDDARARELARQIWSGREASAPMRLAVTGTNLQLKVWSALVELGGRQLTSYGELAHAVRATTATRAVGNAVGANRIAWLIPCHHVLRASGALGGYRWGEDRKRAMLAWESLAPAGEPPRRVAARL